ncbi:MAG: hypothetical protein LBF51_10430 [Zoogloeaceae bacterium]|jgi:hypothetical protein|nr:hypothetical protein [Zoogloeaceae bacterium]
MRLTWEAIQDNALRFAERWKDGRNEKSEAQGFVRGVLAVFGVEDADAAGRFENPVPREGGHGSMDYFWPKKLAVEMKTKGKLKGAFAQLQEYVLHLPAAEIPELLMISDFDRIELACRTTGVRIAFKTKDLRKHVRQFAEIAGYETARPIGEQVEVNVRAAEKMARLHDTLKGHGYEGHDLEVYLVRLLFCMFAKDTGIFPRQSFLDYIENAQEDGNDLAGRIARIFDVLDTPEAIRAKRTLLSDDLRQFRYINGGLFKGALPFADFDAKMRNILIECARFDWSAISPAIFGAMFQGVMDKEHRREIGAHYTSEENILKLIRPLFLDALWNEFERARNTPKALERFHDKISRLKFLDPACGCGNFLILTYRELRLLELEVLKNRKDRQQLKLDFDALRVNVGQFYGIECEDFPCQIAQVGMWLMDHQMNRRVSDFFGTYYARLPLTQGAATVCGNALRMDWENVVPKNELSYILGNPPFIGYSNQSEAQKDDILQVCGLGKVDYVAAWYFKSAQYIQGTQVKCAFVSTNSICQGEQVATVWKPLVEHYSVHINFGVPTFKWSNEAKGKAAVHCVVAGFSLQKTEPNISPYLIEAPTVFVESRRKPVCDVPAMTTGNRPADGGHLIIEAEDYAEFIEKEPNATPYIKRFMGSVEFINGKSRYCLWLKDVAPVELRKLPLVMQRIDLCKRDRENAPDSGRRKLADTPALFRETCNPQQYIAVPKVSSERRRYIPIGFLNENTIASDLLFLIPYATLYHFGILTSSVHMAWVRAVCGRLKSDYRYSKDIVYNNFPWPKATEAQKAEIEELAQSVLDARTRFRGSSLADLYDPLTMPPELLKAHQTLDRAMLKRYGFSVKDTEAAIVARLMALHRAMAEKQAQGRAHCKERRRFTLSRPSATLSRERARETPGDEQVLTTGRAQKRKRKGLPCGGARSASVSQTGDDVSETITTS